MIHLRTLGGLDLRGHDGRELRSILVKPKRLALLVYLALARPRGFHRRDKLVALFWPELDAPRARNALSQALHVLRSRLGEGVLVNRGDHEVGLAPEALGYDALAFEAALAQGRPGEALELYRGELMEGFFLADSPPEFERWLDQERARLKEMAVTAALTAATEEEARGNLPLALHWAHRAVALAPYAEAALQREVAILHHLGDRAGVLRAYEAFERRLREDLELEPPTELRAYIRELQSEEPRRSDPVGAPVTVPAEPEPQAEPAASVPSASRAPSRGTGTVVARWVVVTGIATVLVTAAGMLAVLPDRGTGVEEGTAQGTAASTGSTAPDARVEHSIAVLPFVNMSRGVDEEYFSDGLTEELLNALSRVRDLRVAARTSSFAMKGKELPVDVIAQRLHVTYLLEGSVRRTGTRLRISVRLVRADTGYDLWSETYERELKDVFAVQEDISRRVVTALRGTLSGTEMVGLPERPTDDVAAYELYLRGRYFWNQRTGEALDKAMAAFQAAIARDSTYAQAYAGLADAHNLRAAMGFVPGTEAYPQARTAARLALAHDSTLAEAHAALAFALEMQDADHADSERELRRAIELNPSYAPAHQWYSQMMVLSGTSRFEEARGEMERARELDPLSLAIKTDWARDAYFARRYDLAVERLQGSLEIDPGYARAHSYLGIVYTQQGRYEAAIEEFRKAIELAGGWWPSRFGQAGLARALALAGREAEARRILEELSASPRYVSPVALALIHLSLGDRDTALDALERAWTDRSINPGWLAFDPAWDALRADPRFVRLLRTMNMNPQIPPPASWVAG